MLRYWRIFKIRIAGKYTYLKRVHKWMKGQLFRDLHEFTPLFYKDLVTKYSNEMSPFLIDMLHIGKVQTESPLQNFAMIIPQGENNRKKLEEDPRGAPVYAPCPAGDGLCACTGACKRIVGYSKSPEDIKKYREQIEAFNNFTPPSIKTSITEEKDGVRIWTWETE